MTNSDTCLFWGCCSTTLQICKDSAVETTLTRGTSANHCDIWWYLLVNSAHLLVTTESQQKQGHLHYISLEGFLAWTWQNTSYRRPHSGIDDLFFAHILALFDGPAVCSPVPGAKSELTYVVYRIPGVTEKGNAFSYLHKRSSWSLHSCPISDHSHAGIRECSNVTSRTRKQDRAFAPHNKVKSPGLP